MELLASFFDAFLLIEFVSKYNGYRYDGKKRKVYFVATVSGILLLTVAFDRITIFSELLTLLMICLSMGYCIIALKGTWLKKLLSCMLFIIGSISISTIILFIFQALFHVNIKDLISNLNIYRVALLIIAKTLLFYYTRILLAWEKKSVKRLSASVTLAMLGVPILSIITLALIMEVGIASNLAKKESIYLLISAVSVFITNIITYFLFFHASRQYESKLENMQLLQNIENQKKDNERMAQSNKEIRKIKHDMRNQLLHLGLCLKNNKGKEALCFIEEMAGSIEAVPIIIATDDGAFNSSMSMKIAQAKNMGITLKYHIQIEFKNRISSTDLVRLAGNLMDNAIEACSHVTKSPIIEVNVLEKMNGIQIEVSNSIEKSILQTNPNLETIKQNKENHGLGIYSIKNIVKKYNGSIDIYEKEHRFYVNIIFL